MKSVNLLIRLRHRDGDTYTIEMKRRDPGHADPVEPLAHVRPRPTATVDWTEALTRAANPWSYGLWLGDLLFGHRACYAALSEALNEAGPSGTLRLRLDLDNALHALAWEKLALPDWGPLATGQRILFSRYLDSNRPYPRLPAPNRLRAVVAIADPVDVDRYGLVRPNVALYRGAAEQTLHGFELDPSPATMSAMRDALRRASDVFYLVCHGAMREGEPILFLENEDGKTEPVGGHAVIQDIQNLTSPPKLVVLVSCHGAGDGTVGAGADPLAALGPALVRAGVPAVIAMRDEVTMETAERLLPLFFRELRRDGVIDRALAAARRDVSRRPDAWAPVLFLRLADGNLWAASDGAEEEVDTALTRLAALPMDEVPDPAPLRTPHHMPLAANPLFVGREDTLMQLAVALKGADGAVSMLTAAITGIGGMGKTQLAAEFVHRYGRFFTGGVFWLSFADPAAVSTEIAAAGQALDLPGYNALSIPDRVARVRRAWQEPLPRLLIFDNCEDPALLRRYRPTTGGCRVLVTSRRDRWDKTLGVQTLPLATLPRIRSVELLQKHRAQMDESTAGAIAAELGDLPLALHLAGAFLATYAEFVAPGAYVAQLRDAELLQHPSLQGRSDLHSPTNREHHVGRTFALSYDRLDSAKTSDRTALRLLYRAAYFAAGEMIPTELLVGTLNSGEESGEEDLERRLDVADGLRRLTGLGLLEKGESGYRLHRLVAAFVLGLPEQEALAEARQNVEETVLRRAQSINQRGTPAALLPWQEHLRAVAARALDRQDDRAALLANALGIHLHNIAEFGAARHFLERALEICETNAGPDSPETAGVRASLGLVLRDTGDLDTAYACFQHNLAIAQRSLPPDHPDTAMSFNNLGFVLQDMGRLEEAYPYLERALAINTDVFGPSHPDTATGLNNLGGLLQQMGRFQEALPYLERSLAICQEVLGPDHPDTARAFNNLGQLLQETGQLQEAHDYLVQARAMFEHALGATHPFTAQSIDNLAMLLHATGRLQDAHDHYQQALAIRQELLGPDHPDTATTLNNLGWLLQSMGQLDAARTHFERALFIYERTLGPVHPDTGRGLNNVGQLLQTMGRPEEAYPYMERALAVVEESLGPDHPVTAQCLNNLGMLLHTLNRLDEAAPYLERALAINEKVLGPTHASTGRSVNNMGYLLLSRGQNDEALPYFQRALAIYEAALGPDHTDAALVLNNLGFLAQARGALADAETYFHRARVIMERQLGTDHPQTALTLANLGHVLQAGGRLDEARSYLERALSIFQSKLGDDHPNTRATRILLAQLDAPDGHAEA